MLTATKRIVIISEKVNKYGFRALVDGIDLTQYQLNPIMLWMHQRAFGHSPKDVFLPLGNVIELRIEVLDGIGKCLTGLPVFDDTDEFAQSVFNKYENGTIRMASAGLIPTEWSEETDLVIHGQRGATLTRSILEEVSIVDIGADNNALAIALYDSNHNRVQLSTNNENALIPLLKTNRIDMEKIELTAAKAAALLGVAELTTVDQFETKIAETVQLAARQKTQIETLTREKSELQTKLDEADQIQLAAKVEALVQGAVDSRKITADQKPSYVALATKNYEDVEKILGGTPTTPTIASVIKDASEKDKNVELYSKTYDDLFASGDLEKVKLQAPQEFVRIFKEKFGVEPKS